MAPEAGGGRPGCRNRGRIPSRATGNKDLPHLAGGVPGVQVFCTGLVLRYTTLPSNGTFALEFLFPVLDSSLQTRDAIYFALI